jgi:hypothetical protein
MATLRLHTRKRDNVVVGELRYYPRPGAPQVSVTIEGELTAQRYKEAVERAIADGAPIPPPPGGPRQKAEPEAMTVGDFFRGPFMHRAWPGLASSTQGKYRSCWNVHVTHPEYGIARRTLADIDADPNIVAEMKSAMQAAGIGRSTINNTLGLLGSIFRLAMRTPGSGLRHHPIRGGVVTYESVNPDEPPLPHSPLAVAMVAAEMRDDELISAEGSRLYLMLMNGSGLRPGEDRALRTADIREHTLQVWRAIGGKGELKELKNSKWHYPPVPPGVRAAVLEFARGREFVFPMMQSENAHRDWTKRVFGPARNSVAAEHRKRWPDLGRTTPYDLGRHSFAALYLRGGWWEGYKRQELASWLGHDVRTLERHYAGLIAEYQRDPKPIDPEKELADAWEWLRDATGDGAAVAA